ncbi:hypothetical protein AB6A23_03785 [Paenibacillus tarimensis]
MSQLVVYDAPKEAVGIDDYKVSVRVPGEHRNISYNGRNAKHSEPK